MILNSVGEVMVGVTYGLQYGLLALGLVLVYRSSRFINVAHGQMGVLGALVLGRLALDAHLPYAVALLGALAFGALFAMVLERQLVQPLFNAPRLVLLVASIGIAQVAFSLITIPHSPFLLRLSGRAFPVPFHFSWTIGRVALSSSQVVTLLLAPAIAIALQLVFTRTSLGRTIRAAAANPEAARLAGISVRRTSRLVWVIAGVLSTLTAILQAPQTSTIDVSNLGPNLLVRGLAAALLAGMVDFRTAFVAGIGLGVVEQLALFHISAGASNLVVLGAVLLGIALRAPALARGARAGDDRLGDPASRPPLSERLASLRVARDLGGYGWALMFLVLLMLPGLPGLRTQAQAQSLTLIIAFAVVGLSVTVLTGWAGQISLGQFALLGVGAYTAARAVHQGWAIPLVLLAAGTVAALVALPVGLPALRFRGLFLAVTTLTFAVVAPTWLFRLGIFGERSTGNATILQDHLWLPLVGTLEGKRQLYYVAVGVLGLVLLALRGLRRTGPGRALLAVRDNEAAAAAHGLPPTAVKVVALLLSGFLAGIGGGLWGMGVGGWNFQAFDPSLSLTMLGIAIVGGLGSLYGPVLGAFLVFGAPYLIPYFDNPGWRAFFSGALLLNVLLFLPGGLSSLAERIRLVLLRFVERGLPERPFGPVAGAAPLRISEVSLRFGGIQALQSVSLDVARGEIVGLIGGNGAGKSTLMSCVSGHQVPDSGSIEVFGQQVAGLPPEYRPHLALARTFQDARLYPGLTVLETVLVALDRADRSDVVSALLGAPWVRLHERGKRARAGELLERVGLADRQDALVDELSTGMRRLLDVATVMACRPGLVLLDEPTAGIAQREVEQFAPLLRGLRDDLGCAIVIVEHDMPLLLSLCDRVYCLENGVVVAHGTPQQVREDPVVIASYLGTDAVAVARSTAAARPARRTPARKPRVLEETA
jgi:ABC-type branched-subunit amino acid transport system ATPase component/ABC-type branched-subunit amino acid transport system permease subunit